MGTGDGSPTETWLALRELPGAVLQWAGPHGRPEPLRAGGLEVSWELPLAEGVERPDEPGPGDPRLEVEDAERRLVFRVDPPPERWRLSTDGAGASVLRVTVRTPPASTITVAVAAGPEPGPAATVLGRLPHLDAEVRRWERAPLRDPHHALRLRVPNDEEGRALAWALSRLESLTVGSGSGTSLLSPAGYGRDCPDGDRWIWVGHGLLAAGLFDDARTLLGRGATGLSDRPDPGDPLPSLFVHLAARYLRASGAGDLPDGARTAVASIRDRILAAEPMRAPHRTAVARAAALRELADALEEPGRDPVDPRLRERADRLSGVPREPGAGDASVDASERPTAGLRVTPGELAAVLGLEPSPVLDAPLRADRDAGGAERGLRAWAAWRGSRPEDAFREWRAHLLSGIREARGLWPPGPGVDGGRCHLDGAAVAMTMAPFVFGLLGVEPDAAFGRLRLAPRVPPPWEAFEVDGLAMGDVRVDLRYRRKGGRHTFVVAPVAGRVPPNLVFEPLLPVRRIGRVRVDGDVAELERYRRAGRTGVRLQLPLDGTREVDIEGDEQG